MINFIQKHRPVIAYLVFTGIVVLGSYLYYQRNHTILKNHLKDTCKIATFTRQTQRKVVRYLDQEATVAETSAQDPRARIFYRTHHETLKRLLVRSEPPKCDVK